MANKTRHFYEFGPYRVDPDHRLLLRENQPVPLQPKAFDILLVLAENSERVVLKDDLLKAVWPDTFVEESNLAQNVFLLRKALGDAVGENRYIVTVPGRGYRFAEMVQAVDADDEDVSLVVESHTRSRLVIQEQSGPPAVLPAPRGSLRGFAVAGAALALIAAIGLVVYVRRTPKLTEKDTIVLGDFANSTGDPVFDDTLKTALSIALAESPFLNTLSDNKIRTTLRLMARPADTRIEPNVAREICQRTGGKAYIAGSIAQLGSQYVLTLEALNCQSGDTLAREQVTAAAKEKVLDAIGRAASKLRTELGESLATVKRFDVVLPQATTSSLEALKAYSQGDKFLYQRDPASAPPYFERALELDPNFAMAYVKLGNAYISLNELGRAREYFAKAFALRDRTSELEKLNIAAEYYGYTTGELDKALQVMLEDIEYKHGSVYLGLADVYMRLGQYDKSADAAHELLARDPDYTFGFVNLAIDDLASQNFAGARGIIQRAQTRGIDNSFLHVCLYVLSFVQADPAAMAEQQRWFAGQRIYESLGLALAADTEAYAGHVKKAGELARLAADSALRADNKENAAMYLANQGLQQAAYGNAKQARELASEALKLDPGFSGVEVQAALALAMAGETARAESVAQDLGKRFPLDTQLQLLGIPAIEAQLQLSRRQPQVALNTLRAGLPIEFANTAFSSISTSCLYPTYIRGQAYLAAEQAAGAAAEFQKIVDHNGVVWNCWTGALAHLGLARAEALQSRTLQGADATGARVRALSAYRDFLGLWRDADSDIPLLKQSNAEFAAIR